MTAAFVFTCSICGEPSQSICVYCTKDACANHLCERCRRCSDCCECEVRLTDPHDAAAPTASETVTATVVETAEFPAEGGVFPIEPPFGSEYKYGVEPELETPGSVPGAQPDAAATPQPEHVTETQEAEGAAELAAEAEAAPQAAEPDLSKLFRPDPDPSAQRPPMPVFRTAPAPGPDADLAQRDVVEPVEPEAQTTELLPEPPQADEAKPAPDWSKLFAPEPEPGKAARVFPTATAPAAKPPLPEAVEPEEPEKSEEPDERER